MSDPRDQPTQPASETGTARPEGPRVVALTLAFHRDARRVGERALVLEQESGRPVALGRHALELAHPGEAETRPLLDPRISREVAQLTARGGALTVEPASGAALTIDGRPARGRTAIDATALAQGVLIEVSRSALLVAHHATVGARPPRFGITGESLAVDEVRRAIAKVADLAVPVLVRGETGVGKERVARALHDASGRAGAFVAVNVSTLPPSLAAAELFGHARGAFTGAATPRDGLFARADGGTLLLDEVGELPQEVQPMLLRALERGEVRPVGSSEARPVDVRVVSATDADLEAAQARGELREALVHRLRGFEIRVPPLRTRREDIGRLVVELLRQELAPLGEAGRLDVEGRWIEPALMARLVSHAWPGNVRQLRGVLRQLAVTSRGAPALRADASVERALAERAPSERPQAPAPTDDEIHDALRAHDFSFSRAAHALGLSKTALYRRAETHPRIRPASALDAPAIERALAAHGDPEAAAASLEVSARALRLRMAALGISSPPGGASGG